MKNSKIKILLALTTFMLCFVANIAIAQNSWIGGTPGAENEWSNPKNWSENRVPDWRDESVIISDVSSQSGFFPIISKEVEEIPHLRLEGSTTLTISKNGRLVINGADTYNFGILNIGRVINYGYISIQDTGLSPLENREKNIENRGAFAFIDSNDTIKYLAIDN